MFCLIFSSKIPKMHMCKTMCYLFQTVSCRKCKFKNDCLHMQWILKVCTNICFRCLWNENQFRFFYASFYFFQQIQEKEARHVCHTYKCLKKKKNGKKCKQDEQKIDFDILPVTVADAAKKLCRSILRYKGNAVFFHFVAYDK